MERIIVSGQHLKKYPKLEEYARKKVFKLFKFHSKIEKISVHFVLEKSHRDKEDNYFCELTIDVPGRNIEIRDLEHSFEKAVDRAVERAKRILVKHKEKPQSKRIRKGVLTKLLNRG